jgi:CheY-like chemotaxis protein
MASAQSLLKQGKILIVDDEEPVRLVIKAVLAPRGYQTVLASDGEDAVRKCAESGDPFDLVIMDLHMPRLNGSDALKQIRAGNPSQKALLLSGSLPEADSYPSPDLGGVKFLSKPFDNQGLIETVRQTLDEL